MHKDNQHILRKLRLAVCIFVVLAAVTATPEAFATNTATPAADAAPDILSAVQPETPAPAAKTIPLKADVPAFAAPGASGPVPVAVTEPSADTNVQSAAAVVGITPAADQAAAQAQAATTAAAPAEDPLAKFREAFGASEKPAQDVGVVPTTPPTPTPGGPQQAGDPLAGYDMSLTLTPEEIAAEQRNTFKQEAFEQALDGVMPMSEEQIAILKDKFRNTREASEKRIGGTPEPEVTVQTLSLDPGAVPPTIKVSPGHVTTLNMIDITGAPWPVQDVSWGGNFEILSPGEGGHIIRISPLAAHEVGNLSIMMVGLDTPITMSIATDLEHVQYRFDARIPDYGPKSTPPLLETGITTTAGDKTLLRILDGVPASGTVKYTVTGVDGRTSVFMADGQLYLRTPHTLLSPGWSSSVSSSDGTTVYAIPNTPVVLLSDKGRTVRATLETNSKTASGDAL